jgi:hypothetical protein
MRRKLTAVLLTAAMAISLTACGGSGDTASAGASAGETASVTGAEQHQLPEKKFSGLQCLQIMHHLTGCRRMTPMEQ